MTTAEERWLEMRARLEEGEVRLLSDADFVRDLMVFGRAARLIGCDECGCNTRRKPMGCYVDDCEGCRCATSQP